MLKSSKKVVIKLVTILDVAKYILNAKGEMSTWKLQKLCYYCQAWHYTWTEKRLIAEEFEAWRNGPVCPELFAVHKGKFMVSAEDVSGNEKALDADEKDSVDVVLKDYGDMEPYEISCLTHAEDPWKNARGNLPADAPCKKVIKIEEMGDYYGSLV